MRPGPLPLRFCCLIIIAGCAAFIAKAAPSEPAATTGPSPERFAVYFRPSQTDRAALSPDGRYIAFTLHRQDTLFLEIMAVDNPSARQEVAVAEDYWAPEYSNSLLADGREEKIVARADMLRWMTPTRVVFSSNEGRVFAIDADGQNPRVLATPRDVAETTGKRTRLRRPHVVDVRDGPSGKVLIDGDGHDLELFHADYTTGKLVSVDNIVGSFAERDFLFDQQGNVRLQFYGRQRPQRYDHVPVKSGRVKELDSLVAPDAGISFRISVENYLGTRSIPIGFGYDPNILYYASNAGRDTYGIYALDLRTGKPTGFKVEHPRYDLGDPDNLYWQSILVLDRARRELVGLRFTGVKRQTWWLDPQLAQMQSGFDQKFANKAVEIVDWDDSRTRFLITVSSAADPGTWFIFEPAKARLTEFAKRAPWIDETNRNPSGAFEFVSPSGAKLSGYITIPAKPRVGKSPLVVFCREGAWGRQTPSFSAEVQALAAMGYAVLQVNHRGCEGFGTAFRLAAKDAYDRAPAEDIVAAIDWICARQAINPKLTALYGKGFGGYFALRTMELFPDRFRCGIVIDPQTDLGMLINYSSYGRNMRTDVYRAMFNNDSKRLDAISALHNAAQLTQPILIVRNQDRQAPQSEALQRALSRLGRKPEILPVNDEFQRGPAATANAYAQIESFLNLNVYRFNVKSGETRVVRDTPDAPDEPPGAETSSAESTATPASADSPAPAASSDRATTGPAAPAAETPPPPTP